MSEFIKYQPTKEEMRAVVEKGERVKVDKELSELQLICAHEMRRAARERSGNIPASTMPTKLILVESQVEPIDLKGRTKIVFTPKTNFPAYLVDGRFHAAIDNADGSPIRIYFSPIFLASDGELWTVPDHNISLGDYARGGQELSSEESIIRYNNIYRELLKGADLPSIATNNNFNHDNYRWSNPIEIPRLTTDDDLIDPYTTPISDLIGKRAVVLSRWDLCLDQMAA